MGDCTTILTELTQLLAGHRDAIADRSLAPRANARALLAVLTSRPSAVNIHRLSMIVRSQTARAHALPDHARVK